MRKVASSFLCTVAMYYDVDPTHGIANGIHRFTFEALYVFSTEFLVLDL
jgi:hypothetical protein